MRILISDDKSENFPELQMLYTYFTW